MKVLLIILFLIYSDIFAQEILTFDEIHHIQSGRKKIKKKKIISLKSNLKKELELTKKKLDAYRYISKMQLKVPIIMTSDVIHEADFIGAFTSQAIMATNTGHTTVLSGLHGVDLPSDTKIVCQVYAKYKRICGECTRIIIDGKGHDIDAELHHRDGSSCVIGKISDDKEKYMTGVLGIALAQGALAISQGSIPTVGGNLIQNTASNKIKQGVINAGEEAIGLMKEEYQTSEPIVTLPPHTQVIVHFRKGFDL